MKHPEPQTRYCIMNTLTRKVISDYRRSRQDLLKLIKGKDYLQIVTVTFKNNEVVSTFPDYPRELFKGLV